MNGSAYPKADVDFLYLRRKVAGRAILSIIKCVEQEKLKSKQSLSSSKEEVFKFISARSELLLMKLKQKKTKS